MWFSLAIMNILYLLIILVFLFIKFPFRSFLDFCIDVSFSYLEEWYSSILRLIFVLLCAPDILSQCVGCCFVLSLWYLLLRGHG